MGGQEGVATVIRRMWVFAAALGLLLAIPAGPAASAPEQADPADLIAAMKASAQAEEAASDWQPRLPWAGQPKAQTLVADRDYWVVDVEEDSLGDSMTTPELVSAGLWVRKDAPGTLVLAGLADSDTYATASFGVLLDVNGDGSTDFGAVTGGAMELETAYGTTLYRFVGDDPRPTSTTAVVVRLANGYVLGIPGWRALGMRNVSYIVALGDDIDTDFAPAMYARPVPVGAKVPAVTAAPGKVRGLRVRAKRTKATFRWSRTARASWYQVQLVSRSKTITRRLRTTSCGVSGLRPGKRYTVRIRAGNAIGKGPVTSKRFRARR